MRVCVVGSGAREHALAASIARSADVVATPGNPGIEGTSEEGHRLSSTAAPPEELEADLYVIGPEAPLVDGLADRLRAAGKRVFGPGRAGAALEGSKELMKQVATEAGVPTARWKAFSARELAQARSFLAELEGGYVVKTDGLAGGKGVLVTSDMQEALADLEAKLSGSSFGEAGRRVVVEERLEGAELSLFVVCDGHDFVPLLPAQDYKRLLAGDEGPNTGGMGSYAPVPAVDESVVSEVLDEIVGPSLAALTARGVDYRGLLYAGVMIGADGPRLVEFNVRFGDPETEAILPLLESDLVELLAAAADGTIGRSAPPVFSRRSAVCVVAAAPGYPAAPEHGGLIEGASRAGSLEDVHLFHAGTSRDKRGDLRSSGGRVLAVTALGQDLPDARRRAYEAMAVISFPGMQVRADIASSPLSSPAGAQ